MSRFSFWSAVAQVPTVRAASRAAVSRFIRAGLQSVTKCAADFQLFYSSNADLKKGNVGDNSTKNSKL